MLVKRGSDILPISTGFGLKETDWQISCTDAQTDIIGQTRSLFHLFHHPLLASL